MYLESNLSDGRTQGEPGRAMPKRRSWVKPEMHVEHMRHAASGGGGALDLGISIGPGGIVVQLQS